MDLGSFNSCSDLIPFEGAEDSGLMYCVSGRFHQNYKIIA